MSGADGYRVGVLGATGAVGSTIMEVLSERDFPVRELVPFASQRSAGRKIAWAGTGSLPAGELTCAALSPETIGGFDLIISSAGGSVSSEWAPKFAEAGAVVVDNTSFWRMHEDVPLVVPEVNPDAAERHQGIIANPNCSTMQMIVALAPLHQEAGLERLIVSTYQSVSGTGQKAIEEMRVQSRAVLADEPIPTPEVYPHQIAFNVLPQVESFKDGDDYTTEERKMMAETRKILGLGECDLPISATCARVPVFNAHSESVNVQTREPLSPERAREVLSAAPSVTVVDRPGDALYPLAIEAAGRDDVLVGRIRRDPSHERCLNLWIVGDNLDWEVVVPQRLGFHAIWRDPVGRGLPPGTTCKPDRIITRLGELLEE